MKNFDLSFAAFADQIQPTGAINRFPSVGLGADVFSYSVYMNGKLAESLSADVKQHEFKDVMVLALTEKMGLNSNAARDNLKVAEIVAVRSAWMSAVLESTVERSEPLSGEVAMDWAMLANGMTHPWIQGEIEKQRLLSASLPQSLERAGAAVGGIVRDLVPREVSVGTVVAQDELFTMQRTGEGEVVTHENRRLLALPVLGQEVLVSYYRGSGQVVPSIADITVSPPFIFPASQDLAVTVQDGKGMEQVVLFNSMAGFEKFITAHGADLDLVRQAMDLRMASPKQVEPPRVRELVSRVYTDPDSQCLSIDYKEGGVVYSAMFGSLEAMEKAARDYGLTAKDLEDALQESRERPHSPERAAFIAWDGLVQKMEEQGYKGLQESMVPGRAYMGKIVAASSFYVAQDTGRGGYAIHDIRNFDKAPSIGDSLTVKFDNGRGVVSDMVRASKDIGR